MRFVGLLALAFTLAGCTTSQDSPRTAAPALAPGGGRDETSALGAMAVPPQPVAPDLPKQQSEAAAPRSGAAADKSASENEPEYVFPSRARDETAPPPPDTTAPPGPLAMRVVERTPDKQWSYEIWWRERARKSDGGSFLLLITHAYSVPVLALKGGRTWKKVHDGQGKDLEATLAGADARCTFFDCTVTEKLDVELEEDRMRAVLVEGLPLKLESATGETKAMVLPPLVGDGRPSLRAEPALAPTVEVGPATERVRDAGADGPARP